MPVNATGFLQAPVYNLVFSSSVTGLISDIYVHLGQTVVANQPLAHLGYNTYDAQLRAAQVAVDAARNELNAAQAHVLNQLDYIHAQVVLAQTTLNAELNNRQALIRQANANVHFAQVTLDRDQATLDAVIRASNAAIKVARDTEQSAIAACQATPATSGTPASTGNSDNNNSNNNDNNSDSSDNSNSSCIKAAQDAFRAAVATADQAVVTAQGTVAKDRAALQQAQANADVDLTAVAGRINEARASIDVARLNPDRTNALIALTSAEYLYRTSLAALLVIEETIQLLTLRAPHAGTVTAIIGTIGGQPGAVDNLVPAGGLEIQSDHGGLTFIQLTDTTRVNRIQTYVDETDIQKVRLDQGVSFTLKAYGTHKFSGHVIQIAPNGLGYPGTTTSVKYLVIVQVDDSGGGSYAFYHHMTANVTIST
ncbi:HlyD family secretion protein [Dictyobacter kobayashii]|uniref:Membrane fusion protein biotin-lipoyl like domain-containing protein n=1 Tax=Dictyobacter kobayashii TaxID=2014872 RepID=A0A402AQX9_9CHLR|nr:efflux RND transporter periplasmic adaptor subunit [Dictyobacter kobayashii]GCE21500.1 hypothetical protein KDK_53000 [Dictyobacter kobayashii]